uniref:ATP synthase subunit a n=1 Tax=Caligus clemensi TaxID=344056 RepID=E1B2Q1_CALCM|nr:ATP synthase F0 subunit 6 [Caligus clemensi]
MNFLFSSFDADGFKNWLIPLGGMMIMMPTSYWLISNTMSKIFSLITETVFSDLNALMGEKNQGGEFMFMGLFLCIIMMNGLGLFPYIFTSSSHLCISLGLGLPLWLGSQMMCWFYFTNESFSHLVPEGSPSMLVPLLVLIELVSNMIRPMTLSIRLMANMVAGHLLLTLLGGGANLNSPMLIIGVMLGLMVMLLLELGVGIIQGYVFMLLSSLYVLEVMH